MAMNLFGEKTQDNYIPPEPKTAQVKDGDGEDKIPDWSIRDPNKLYFTHRQYPECPDHPPIVVEYVGALYYTDGRKVEDFVSVRFINDLGLREFCAGAFGAVAKRLLSPYRDQDLPDPFFVPRYKPERKQPSPTERINKTTINTRRSRR